LPALKGCGARLHFSVRTILFGLALMQLTGCQSPKPAPTQADQAEEQPGILIARSDSLFETAEQLRLAKKHEEAVRLHEEALALRKKVPSDDQRIFYSNWRLGQALVTEQKVEASDARFDEARRISESLPLPYDTIVSLLLGASYSKKEIKDFTTARSLAALALQLLKAHPEAYALKAKCYHAFGNTYYNQQRYSEAIGYFQQEESISIKYGIGANLSAAYFGIGLCHLMPGNSKEALRFLNKSQTIREQLYGRFSDNVSAILLNKSGAFLQLGLRDSASFCIKRNLEIRTHIYGVKSIYCAGAREMVGKFFESGRQYDSALIYYQGSLRSVVKDFNESDYHINPRPAEAEVSGVLARFLVNKAHLLKAMFELDTTRTEALMLSLDTYQLADSVFQGYQNKLAYDDPKLANLEARPISYEEMADIASTLFRTTGEEKFLQDLLHVMEQSRSSVLKGALAKASSYRGKNVPDSLRVKEKNLQQKRTQLVSMAAAADNERESDSIDQAVLRLDRDYQKLLVSLRDKDPGYSLIRHGLDPLSINELKQLMKDKEGVWIEYLWGKKHIYMIGVSGEHTLAFQLRTSPLLLKSIQWLSANSRTSTDSALTKKYFRRYCETSNFLYQQLVAPLLVNKTVKRIIICPEGPLNSLPFDVLLSETPADDEIDYHLAYLVNQFAISYHFSTAYLQRQAGIERRGASLIALGYGATQSGKLVSLPGTLEEVSAIGKVMDDKNNSYLVDEEASERSFKSKVAQYNILHLAVHGVADTANAINSKLLFRAGGDGEDGELFAHEVYGLNLDKLDLAVLSACESGTGKAQPGEGVMSIARGFAYAQCPSLIMSLWKINDKTSATIMAKFYGELNDGNDIDEALAQAKRNYLKGEKQIKSHPSYWAAFIAMGETKAIVVTRYPWKFIFLLVAFLFIGIVIRVLLGHKKSPARAGSFLSH
jgi:CHAT domain-containing protein